MLLGVGVGGVVVPTLATYRLPAASRAIPWGLSSWVRSPLIVRMGAALPLAPRLYTVMLLVLELATKVSPAAFTATPDGLVSPLIVRIGAAGDLSKRGGMGGLSPPEMGRHNGEIKTPRAAKISH